MASASATAAWPHGAKAALSFTMDNLGEAQDVRTGAHPSSQPIGQSPAVLTTLPRMLDLLDKPAAAGHAPVKATYFAESWSLPVYPAAVAELQLRGHEVAWHGYQHEVWKVLSGADEEDSFARSFEAAGKHGVVYEGFRPPGGDINGARTFDLLRRYGVRYVSPLGRFGVDAKSGVVVLPFEWETVDAFWYMDKFAAVRKAHGVQEDEAGPTQFRDYLYKKIEDVKREGGYISILFHPFLQTSQGKFKVLEEVLERISNDGDLWLAPCNEVARWVAEHADQFALET
ncbi:hypothetical protein M406DRAFT_244706 [Cryphonectria parasitica EP155]|uniref:NodB homology domain-containing protein n=1 Tax=Cryphonectria parasitica (strain ATCC 38755 / EP155) TaxID=660469 RepID=A0A9P5CUJ0_CRYP1|nr:uncharacterized protein M406DRAFT_244706 [Cryphonectria parasitica EP155]KAF3771363.1 hypothetical protein M406DRAFT_244706 [Cryphonectria parasitica EP155]